MLKPVPPAAAAAMASRRDASSPWMSTKRIVTPCLSTGVCGRRSYISARSGGADCCRLACRLLQSFRAPFYRCWPKPLGQGRVRGSQPPCQALSCPCRTPHATAWAPGALPGVACTLASWSLMLLLVLQEHLAACSRLPSCSAIMFLLHGVVLADLTAQTTTSRPQLLFDGQLASVAVAHHTLPLCKVVPVSGVCVLAKSVLRCNRYLRCSSLSSC